MARVISDFSDGLISDQTMNDQIRLSSTRLEEEGGHRLQLRLELAQLLNGCQHTEHR